jgi:hypothetical protein
MGQLIGTLLQWIIYRVLVADYNLKIFLRAKVDSLRLFNSTLGKLNFHGNAKKISSYRLFLFYSFMISLFVPIRT